MMMSNSIEPTVPREYLCIASRFLKEVGLYPYWIKYVNSPKSPTPWSNIRSSHKPLRSITDVLGWTSMTGFLIDNGFRMTSRYMLYEYFAGYLLANGDKYKEYINNIVKNEGCLTKDLFVIDNERKIVSVEWK